MIEALQFTDVKGEAARYAVSELGKEAVLALEPSINKQRIESWHREVTEAKNILQISSSIPLHGLKGVTNILDGLHKGLPLRIEQFMGLYELLSCVEKLKRFMKDKTHAAPMVSAYVNSLSEVKTLADEIFRCIRNGKVDDYASKHLLTIRKQLTILEDRMKNKLDHMVKSAKYRTYLQESVISIRNGRYVIPVKKEYRKNIKGALLDASASGSTVYIEPEEITAIQDDLQLLKEQELIEEDRILMILTGLVEQQEFDIKLAIDTMVQYDLIFAKAKYSVSIQGQAPIINQEHLIRLIAATHPLLKDKSVPLNIVIGDQFNALVITGPNTGGKTVTIKTVGLLTLMAQSGFHIPAAEGSQVAIFHRVLVDIGDGQSITESLSTFSSRIKNIIHILSKATPDALVLLDELGSGTDPAEGMGLATAILEELYKKGATLLATTHYNEIKGYAQSHDGFENGSMAFDVETLQPTYRLQIGKGGESQAFAIALKLGMHPKLIEKAHEITYKTSKDFSGASHYSSYELDHQLAWNEKHVKKQKHKNKEIQTAVPRRFKQGDNVKIPSMNEFGIVYQSANERGEVEVFVKGKRMTINQKRLSLYIKAEDLYPEDYDMSIIFETKENRKRLKEMSKHHIDESVIRENN